ncbi:MAG: LptF/LptG family permease [Phycisphaerales bacterium]|jgi:lipopolysaccharide export LptBFGC system permease protein LptF|nr:LptF/LptG family permease [Phycisphaerales bacterium]MBT7171190.1 LptF/LptG family permease [Phycisphaerales bacterium]
MVRTLDRYILRSYFQSFFLCLLVMLSIRVVGDLSAKMDEFAEYLNKVNPATSENYTFMDMVAWMGVYYSNQMAVYVSELGGTILVAAAAFTVARMNYTNELTAMLASGVSLHRVVVPILLAAVAFSALIAVDQEYIIPALRENLIQDPDAHGDREGVKVRLVPDERSTVWYAREYDPNTKSLVNPMWILRDSKQYTYRAHIFATKATEGALDGKSGWLTGPDGRVACRADVGGEPWHTIQGGQEIFTELGPVPLHDIAYREYQKLHPDFKLPPGEFLSGVSNISATDSHFNMTLSAEAFLTIKAPSGKVTGWKLRKPRFVFHAPTRTMGADGRRMAPIPLATILADEAVWVPGSPLKQHWALRGGSVFYQTDLRGFKLELIQTGRMLEYSSNEELTRMLDSQTTRDPKAVLTAKYIRFVNPINNVIMLMLGLPFILSRQRNIKASALLCVLIVAAFFGFIYICRYLNLPPFWAACLPTLLFGPVSVLMHDAIKT